MDEYIERVGGGKMPGATDQTRERDELFYDLVLDGWFEIDKDGRIWRLKRRVKGGYVKSCMREQAGCVRQDGYRVIGVSLVPEQPVLVREHRIVYRYFFGPIPPGMEINHKNGLKDDNRPDNLELVTHAQNLQHAFDMGLHPRLPVLMGETNPHAKLTEEQVREIRARRKAGEKTTALAEEYSIGTSQVSKIANGKNWAHI